MSKITASLVYSEAKKALNASAPDNVVGREKENDEIENYLFDCFSNKKAMSLYVNGQPGTGKTLSVTSLLENLKVYYKKSNFYMIWIVKIFLMIFILERIQV